MNEKENYHVSPEEIANSIGKVKGLDEMSAIDLNKSIENASDDKNELQHKISMREFKARMKRLAESYPNRRRRRAFKASNQRYGKFQTVFKDKKGRIVSTKTPFIAWAEHIQENIADGKHLHLQHIQRVVNNQEDADRKKQDEILKSLESAFGKKKAREVYNENIRLENIRFEKKIMR